MVSLWHQTAVTWCWWCYVNRANGTSRQPWTTNSNLEHQADKQKPGYGCCGCRRSLENVSRVILGLLLSLSELPVDGRVDVGKGWVRAEPAVWTWAWQLAPQGMKIQPLDGDLPLVTTCQEPFRCFQDQRDKHLLGIKANISFWQPRNTDVFLIVSLRMKSRFEVKTFWHFRSTRGYSVSLKSVFVYR